jgi:hypothetical protein
MYTILCLTCRPAVNNGDCTINGKKQAQRSALLQFKQNIKVLKVIQTPQDMVISAGELSAITFPGGGGGSYSSDFIK